MEPAIAVTGALVLLEAVAYLWGYGYLRRRSVQSGHRGAWLAFLGWWIGTAVSSIITAVRHGAFLAGYTDGGMHALGIYVVLSASYLGTGGLLVYLFTLIQDHKPWQWVWLVVAFALVIQSGFILFGAGPQQAIPAGPTLGMEYATPLSPWLGLSALPFVLLPLALLVVLVVQSRGLGDVSQRTRRFAGLLAGWIITKAILSGGALGLAPDAVTWVARVLAILAAIGLARYAIVSQRVGAQAAS